MKNTVLRWISELFYKKKELESVISHAKNSLEPDLSIENFELWITGRQFSDSEDYWDGNWLDVVARCVGESAVVQVSGPIVHLSELTRLLSECKQVYATLSGEAHLACMEPNLDLKITMKALGNCELSVFLTPDHLYQEHSFTFDLDQSYLPPLIKQLECLLKAYPLKGIP